MKKLIFPAAIAVVLLSSAFTFVAFQNWSIGTDYSVKFTDKNADGVFKDLKGNIVFNTQDPAAARFDVTIAVSSINTGNGLKNRHAKSEKWFDADKYPTIHFVSAGAVKTATGYETKGELNLHGVKKMISIPFTFDDKSTTGTFKGVFKINRTEFGIGEAKENEKDFTTLEVTVPVTGK